MAKPTVLIIGCPEDAQLKERLSKHPEIDVVGSAANAEVGRTLAERLQPTVVAINVDLPENRGVSLAESLALELPMSSLVLVTASDSKRVLHLALQVGAKDVVTLPVEDDRLFRSIQKAGDQSSRRRQMFSIQRKPREEQFKTITVFSTKGGVGKTTVALNLGMAIRVMTGKRVALVDLDLISGNLGLMAGVAWKRSLKDLVDDVGGLDVDTLDAYFAEHPSGVRILSAPVQIDVAEFVQAEHVQKVLGLMSSVFNYIVIDAPTYLHDTVIPALEQSRDIVLVTTLDLAAIQNLRQCMELLDRLSMKAKVKVVVNKAGYFGGLKVKDLETELGVPVQCVIPEMQKLAVDAVNLGRPAFLAARRSVFAQRIEELAASVLAVEDRPKRSRFSVKEVLDPKDVFPTPEKA